MDETLIASGTRSPYIPGTNTQFAWDSTSLGYLKTCPRLYQYIMIEGYSSREESVHLRFGVELHTALQDFDNYVTAGETREAALVSITRELLTRTADFAPDPETRAGKYKSRAALVRTVINHIDHYRDDPAKTYVLSNGRAATELSFRFELPYGPTPDQPYLLAGHLDKVVEFNGDLYVKDYKTTLSTPSSNFFDQFEPSNQMTLYALGAQVILGSPVKGVIIDACQILVDSNRFTRGFTFRSTDQLTEWQEDLGVHLTLAQAYAKLGHWPQNDTACDKFGGCRFRQVCSKSPHVRHIYLKNYNQQSVEERWNPLKSRDK